MKLSKINNVLLTLIIGVNLYVIVAPLIPAVTFRWDNRGGTRQKQLAAAIRQDKPAVSEPNHIVIPSMLLDQPLLEGPVSQQYKTLDQGIWRWPRGSTPDKGGNTTLIGHRFTYTSPKSVFYYLDKVKLGDEIGLWWHNQKYVYKVSSTEVVSPDNTSIQDNTRDDRLTLFTCAPLWLPKNRLVVVAKLETNP